MTVNSGKLDVNQAMSSVPHYVGNSIAHSLFKSSTHLTDGCFSLAERCVKGINRES